jgi:predicted nucleotidyltransferase component of viral defense system
LSKERPSNVAASARQRLLNLARERNEEFQFVLGRYAVERLLYRLSRSVHEKGFVLKGATLFALWTGEPHRSTLDVDLLSESSDDVDRLLAVFREVVTTPVEDDGLVIEATSLQGERIREEQHYHGVRLTAIASLAGARIPMQIDIGFGDAVVPTPEQAEYPTLLDSPHPTLRVYPKETAVAEKFEAMVLLGMANSRMKDFYDLYVVQQLAGHADVNTTKKYYLSVQADDIRKAKRLQKALLGTITAIATDPKLTHKGYFGCFEGRKRFRSISEIVY